MAQKRSASKRKTSSRQNTKAQLSARRQAAAVILMAVAILLLCIVIIPGESVWGGLRALMLGVFGLCAYFLPILTGYVAVINALEKSEVRVSAKLWQGFALQSMLCCTFHLFATTAETFSWSGWWETLKTAYTAEIWHGGVLGAILGYPLRAMFTDVGSKIIIILLTVVFLMLVTGLTIPALIRAFRRPVERTYENIEQAILEGAEKRAELEKEREEKREEKRARRASIDIELGEGYPGDAPAEETVMPEVVLPVEEAPQAEKLTALKKSAKALKQEKKEVEEAAAAFEEEVKKEEEEEPKDSYRYPPISLLDEAKVADADGASNEMKLNAETLVNTLNDFGVSTKVVAISRGPSVTRYELEPSAGVRISRITNLADDIALRLSTTGVRIEAPIPNRAAVGIEVPNKASATVCLRELIDSKEFASSKGKLTVALGKDIAGKIVLADLAKMPHLLIAGTTGSGKSVCTNSMIQSVLYRASPEEVRLLLIDPKQVEFGIYNGIPHLLVPVVTDPRKAAGALGWAVTEMLNRYKTFAENNVRDLESYNALARRSDTLQPMPLIMIVIDELADLMMAAANEVEDAIIRLAQMARAAGMHLVIATQRPSVDVITGLIKANIPSRLALTVASQVDSRTILDAGGAEKLLGKGDMLFMPVGYSKPMRVQGCFVSNREVESVVDFLKSSQDEQEYDAEIIEEIDRQAAASGKTAVRGGRDDDGSEADSDEMLPQAIEVVVEAGQASTSLLQRKLRLGYARAGRIMDEMEQKGIIGPHEGSKPRQVLITRQQWLEMNMSREEE